MRKLFFLLPAVIILSSCTQVVTLPPETKTIIAQPSIAPPTTHYGVGLFLKFHANSGDRIACEVPGDKSNNLLLFSIIDPDGNTIAESARKTFVSDGYYQPEIRTINVQDSPWVYSFFAATSGDYQIKSTIPLSFSTPAKVVVYPK